MYPSGMWKWRRCCQQQNFHQQNVDRIDGEIERLSSELQEVLDSLKESTEAVELKRNSITEIEKTIEASHTTKSDTETKLKDDIAHKEELSAKQKNLLYRQGIPGRENDRP